MAAKAGQPGKAGMIRRSVTRLSVGARADTTAALATVVASAHHETALVAELPGLIELALGSAPQNAQLHFARRGAHTVAYGVMEF